MPDLVLGKTGQTTAARAAVTATLKFNNRPFIWREEYHDRDYHPPRTSPFHHSPRPPTPTSTPGTLLYRKTA